jgi:mannitol-1-phosphate 5-dehydrogenase
VIGEIRDADVITTAVWAENLPRIAPILARGLLARLEAGAPRINVLACENALGNSQILRDAILALGVIDPADLAEAAAFPNTAVDRLVLGAERDGEKVIDVGRDFELVVDATALTDPGQEPIRHVIYTADLATYIERKLYIINGGHAWAGYVGHIAGLTIIQDVFFDPAMVAEVRATMLETAALLHVTRGFDLAELEDYIDFAIGRFQTPGISDTVNRVARSPIRKLQRHERLVAPARLCAEHGLSYRRLAHGIGAAYHFDNPDDPQSVELLAYVAANGIEAAVSHFSGLEPGDPVFAAIVAAYHETEAPS